MEVHRRDWAPCGKPDLSTYTSEESLCASMDSFDASPRTPCSQNSSTNASPALRKLLSRSRSQPMPTVIHRSVTIEKYKLASLPPIPIIDRESNPPLDIDFEREVSIVSYLGGGNAADVYEAVWRELKVAVKLFNERQGPVEKQAFRSELETLARLRHRNVVRFLGASARPHCPAIIQELAEQGSLYDLIHRCHVRPQYGRLLEVLKDVAAAMRYCHGLEPPVVHRDLKTHNVLLADDGSAMVADFGISRVKQASFLSTANPGAGTVAYAAPETFRNENVDEKCDVYSFGVIIWECLTGVEPWKCFLPMQIVVATSIEGRRLPTPDLCPAPLKSIHSLTSVDGGVRDLLSQCFEERPSQRPSFEALYASIDALTKQSG